MREQAGRQHMRQQLRWRQRRRRCPMKMCRGRLKVDKDGRRGEDGGGRGDERAGDTLRRCSERRKGEASVWGGGGRGSARWAKVLPAGRKRRGWLRPLTRRHGVRVNVSEVCLGGAFVGCCFACGCALCA